jgi:lysophospholipase L1-like esterase
MRFEKGDKVVFIGDSITDCGRSRPLGEGLSSAFGDGWVRNVAALMNAVHPELRLRAVNMGTGGDTSRNLRDRWETDVLGLSPDWVSVMIGVNDVWRQFDMPQLVEAGVPLDEYKAILKGLVERTVPKVKGVILMTPFFLEPNRQDPMRARLDEYGQTVRDLAREHGLVLVDAQAAMDRFLRHHHSSFIGWDRVHVDATGNMILALEWLRAVGVEL